MSEKVWVSFMLTGEPARIIRDAKKRGYGKSTRDVVVQALLMLGDRVMERELKAGQVRALDRAREYSRE